MLQLSRDQLPTLERYHALIGGAYFSSLLVAHRHIYAVRRTPVDELWLGESIKTKRSQSLEAAKDTHANSLQDDGVFTTDIEKVIRNARAVEAESPPSNLLVGAGRRSLGRTAWSEQLSCPSIWASAGNAADRVGRAVLNRWLSRVTLMTASLSWPNSRFFRSKKN